MKFCKKWWFYILVPIIMFCAIMSVDTSDPIPYKDYIFYGIAQNKVTSKELKVAFTVKGLPEQRHTMYVELVYPDNSVDFLYSNDHTKAHRHHSKDIKSFKSVFKLPKLPAGKYKLRVRFEFDTPGWGRLMRDVITSNDIEFEVK